MAVFAFSLFLVVMLGTNSAAAAGGPLTWFAIWRLPTAQGLWAGIGPVSLLPVVSVAAWLGYRWLATADQRSPWTWGWRRITWPIAALYGWAVVRSLMLCAGDHCSPSTIVRLLVLAVIFFWVYLFIANERPDLLWVIVPVLLIQPAVAVGQFVTQGDVGLPWLGELPLDPEVSGVNVILNQGERWLRGYGLTNQPNNLAIVLVVCLLALPVISRGAKVGRRTVTLLALATGITGMLVTLSRWAWFCLIVGAAINTLPYLGQFRRKQSLLALPRSSLLLAAAILVAALGFLALYGNAVYGRFFDLDNPLEMGSRLVRLRDMGIGLQIISISPLIGTGPASFGRVANEILPGAGLVPSVPLFIAAELGLLGLACWVTLLIWPLRRAGAFGPLAPVTALWLGIFLLGLFYVNPNPLYEVRSTFLVAISAGLVAVSAAANTSSDGRPEEPHGRPLTSVGPD